MKVKWGSPLRNPAAMELFGKGSCRRYGFMSEIGSNERGLAAPTPNLSGP